MKSLKTVLVDFVPYGIVEKRRKKQREEALEQKRIEKEERQRQLAIEREKREKEKEQARKRKEEERRKKEEEEKRRKAEERKRKEEQKKRKEEEAKRKKFLEGVKIKGWGKFYAEFHETLDLEESWILYEAYAGRGLVSTPNVVFQAFMKRSDFSDYVHIWVVDEEQESKLLQQEYQDHKNVIFIYYQSKAYAYFLASAKYLINNHAYPETFSKKEGQVCLNTWHGVSIQKQGYDLPDGRRLAKNVVRNLLMCDYLVSANDFMTKVFEDAFRLGGLFAGKYIDADLQNGVGLESMTKEALYHKLKLRGVRLDLNRKVILYAPAWTEEQQESGIIKRTQDFYDDLVRHINMKEYQIFVKLHPYLYKQLREEQQIMGCYIPGAVDESELLPFVDLLITDYSGICFACAQNQKPVLLYAPDYQRQKAKSGFYYHLEELPGIYTESLEQLLEQIKCIEKGSLEDCSVAQAKEQAIQEQERAGADQIIDVVFCGQEDPHVVRQTAQTGKKKILMYAGSLLTGGATSAALSLLNAIDYQKFDISLFVMNLPNDGQIENFNRIHKKVRVLLRCNSPSMTEAQKRVFDDTKIYGLNISQEKIAMQDYLMEREYIRSFGGSQFDYILNFSGTLMFSCLVLKKCIGARKLIWLHSDMKHEFENEVRRIRKNINTTIEGQVSVYRFYQKIVSVNKVICEINQKALATEKTREKFAYCTNLLDSQRITEQLHETGICRSWDKQYIQIVNQTSVNGILEAMLIPYDEKSSSVKFVTVGRCVSEKNHRNIILALKRLIEEGVSCQLYIVGDGYMREELEELAAGLEISDHVMITGFIANPFAVLKECDCFIFPSFYEAQPYAVLEARIVGLPIIVSNYPAVESVLMEDKQYVLRGTDADAIYEGMRAYLDGKVRNDYHFDVDQYNRKAYQEFVDLLEKG